ncbi:MAG: methyltransferase [Synergistaceae bacterium]
MSESTEKLLNGILNIKQPDSKKGPRVNIDTILLASYTKPRSKEKILEIGCAHGAISLILAKRGYNMVGIDIQPHLIELAKENATINELDELTEFFTMNIKDYKKKWESQSFDRIVVNPPYNEPWTSKQSPSRELATAMHGIECSLEEIICASKYLLNNKGYLNIVIRSNRLGELFMLLSKYNIAPKRMKAVYPKRDELASVVLIEAIKASGHGIKVEPPLFILDKNGEETEELLSAYRIEVK